MASLLSPSEPPFHRHPNPCRFGRRSINSGYWTTELNTESLDDDEEVMPFIGNQHKAGPSEGLPGVINLDDDDDELCFVSVMVCDDLLLKYVGSSVSLS